MPVLRIVKSAWTDPPTDPVTEVGVTFVNSRSGAPELVTVTRTPVEQLLVVSDSPDTASAQIPK